MMDTRTRKPARPQHGWAWSNWGRLIGVEYRRKSAVAAVEAHTGEPWSKARKYMEVWKCTVTPKTP